MLKPLTAISISILLSLYIVSAADADDRSRPNPATPSKSSLINKQSKSTASNISKSDLEGIQQAISQHYGKLNQIASLSQRCGRSRFYEVKSLKLISFVGMKAKVKLEIDNKTYDGVSSIVKPYQCIFKPVPIRSEIAAITVSFKKIQGKWVF
jgi:hypothetical protein